MAKAKKTAPKKQRPSRAPKLYAGKTRAEWRDLGEEIGRRMEKTRTGGMTLGEEIDAAATRIGDRIRRRLEERRERARWREMGREFGREWEGRWERGWNQWWFSTFGLVGPILGSVFGIAWLVICIWLINFVNIFLALKFIAAVTDFLWANLGLFFAASLFFGYGDYFVKRSPGGRWLVQPVLVAMGITFALWITMRIIEVINASSPNPALASAAAFLAANLQAIFVALLIIGYVVSVTGKLMTELAKR